MPAIKPTIENFLNKFLPGVADEIHAIRDRQQIQRVERRLGLDQISRKFTERHGFSVLAGPFQGMSYVTHSAGSTYIPKLLGSYELELHGVISNVVAGGYHTIIDVGCAEGYYAVGLARLMPGAEVFAFDTASSARKLCTEMAETNGVASRLCVHGACSPKQLNDLLGRKRAVIICDCEGYEYQLLRPDLVPGLQTSAMLVELHPWTDPDAAQTFLEEWRKTHEVSLIRSVRRNPDEFPHLTFLDVEQRQKAVNELRPENQMWAFMKPHAA